MALGSADGYGSDGGSAEVTALKNAIDKLPSTPIPLPSIASVPAPLIAKSSPSKSRFSRFRAPFRRISSAGVKKLAQTDSGTSSTESLVGKDNLNPPITQTQSRDTASDLLSLLAPLVSSLQTLGLRLKDSESVEQEMIDDFRGCCTDLEDRINIYNTPIPDQDAELNAHDLEMRTLLLDALGKKVIAERTSCPEAHVPAPLQAPSPLNASPPSTVSRTSSTSGNPFVLHSSDIIGSRRSSTPNPMPIPIGAGAGSGIGIGGGTGMGRGTHLGPYPSFADASHQTGLSNVFRLGSFQNSLLFSPSPVAVRQPLPASGMRM